MPKESDFWTVTTSFLLTHIGSSELGSTGSFFFYNEFNKTKKNNSHIQRGSCECPVSDSRNYVHICMLDFTSESTGPASAKWGAGTYPAFPAVAGDKQARDSKSSQ